MDLGNLWSQSKELWAYSHVTKIVVICMWGMIACLGLVVGVEAYTWTFMLMMWSAT